MNGSLQALKSFHTRFVRKHGPLAVVGLSFPNRPELIVGYARYGLAHPKIDSLAVSDPA
jgi:hypothetical protein